jgi:DNA-directed RNA polymerase subunit M/transcription elongation factor TFIIS
MCRAILVEKEVKGRVIGVCSCGFMRTGGISISGEDENKERNNLSAGNAVDESTNKIEGFSRVCEKCGFDKCEAFSITSNESEVTIFRCLKCKHSIRQAQGSSKA